jgi:HSP20 family protein
MIHSAADIKECLIYPGSYTPLPEVEKLMQKHRMPDKDLPVRPLINMDEFKDHLNIEVLLPGVKREELLIYAHDNILSLVVFHKDRKEANKELQIHEFEPTCLQRHILLPDNADVEFISANYSEGVLKLHIPKTKEPFTKRNTRIVVY